MSLIADTFPRPFSGSGRFGLRFAVAVGAAAAVAGLLALLAWSLSGGAAVPTKAPFGMKVSDAAPAASGLGAYVLALQNTFFRSLEAAVADLKASGAAVWSLFAVGFVYGVFHAAGPGHGKAVIAGYIVSDERTLAKGFVLSLAAAFLQAVVAVTIVLVTAAILNLTAAAMSRVTGAVEFVSFACVAALGATMTWKKAGKLVNAVGTARDRKHPASPACDHAHLPGPDELARVTRWREVAAVIVAAGIRPCTGALILLVFALSQGLLPAGIGATFAMALGTALTTGSIAALAVFAKTLALRLAGRTPTFGEAAGAGLELLAAAFVLVLGFSLFFGLWSSTSG